MAESKGVAITAVIVTGLVGVTGSIVTWRAGVASQRSSAHNARVEADLAEARALLDRSLVDLENLFVRVDAEYARWANHPFPRSITERRQLHRPVHVAFIKAGIDRDRLKLRLGGAAVVRTFDHAQDRLGAAGSYHLTHRPSASNQRAALAIEHEGAQALADYTSLAHEAVGSQLK